MMMGWEQISCQQHLRSQEEEGGQREEEPMDEGDDDGTTLRRAELKAKEDCFS